MLTSGFVVVDIDALELEVAVAVIGAGGVDAVLVRDHLPELGARARTDAAVGRETPLPLPPPPPHRPSLAH